MRFNPNIYDKSSLQPMRDAGRIAAMALDVVEDLINNNPNLRLIDIENAADKFITSMGGIPECKGYKQSPINDPYRFATCISPDEVACHGLPSEERLKSGSIVNVDLVVRLGEWLGDTSRTFTIGEVSEEDAKLVKIAKEAMYAGMSVVHKGAPFKIVGHAIETYCRKQKIKKEPVRILTSYCGHGISKKMHEAPLVEHTKNDCMFPITPYHYFTIEPIITTGNSVQTYVEDDTWTVKMSSGRKCAQFEHTMTIDESGELVILTVRDQEHEKLIKEELKLIKI